MSSPSALENGKLKLSLNPETGALSSLVLKDDPDRMNWIHGLAQWGMVKHSSTWWGELAPMKFLDFEQRPDASLSRYQYEALQVEVTRTLTARGLEERYLFRNIDCADLYVQRGEIGIYATVEDCYDSAQICETQHCNVHL